MNGDQAGVGSPSPDHVWRQDSLVRRYLEGVRGAIPLADEQIRLLLRILRSAQPGLRRFLDLGCGDGVLGHAVLDAFPRATGIFLDFSDAMLASARSRLAPYADRVAVVRSDYGLGTWAQNLDRREPVDAVISGFSIHHQPNSRKRELYRDIFALLGSGGVFLNLEHVASTSAWGETLFDEHFVDALVAHQERLGGAASREATADRYYRREDKHANILERVDAQCDWLREIGFERVDCFFKVFELALFGGIKP